MNAYNQITPETIQEDMRYLQLLSHSFPTIADASTEIINLEAILNLPKGTEHFLADLHGEYEAFQHVLRNASGAIKRKVNEIFGNTLRENEKKELCTLIYYPEQKLELIKGVETDIDDWYVITLNQLVRVCQNVSSKYTRSKVRKALPKEFSYIIQELLHESSMVPNKQAYINVIISTIISTRRADDFIIALCQLIQRLTIDTLHVLGDIFDRGPAPHRIMDILCNYQGFKKCVLILVFDAYRVPGSPGSIEQYHNIHVVYTKEAETADMFIERVTHEIGRNRRVRVATSDGMEQIIILGHGALRVSARMFHEEVQNVEKQIRALVQGEA